MMDYSVRYRCQGRLKDGSHCARRGRNTLWALGQWFCWQHLRLFCDFRDEGKDMIIFQPELLRK